MGFLPLNVSHIGQMATSVTDKLPIIIAKEPHVKENEEKATKNVLSSRSSDFITASTSKPILINCTKESAVSYDVTNIEKQNDSNQSRALRQAQAYRAKMITFCLNGQPFQPQTRLALLNKEFRTLPQLFDHLTQRLGVPVRYLFDLSGQRIVSLTDLQHNHAYVASNGFRFQPANYARVGQLGMANSLNSLNNTQELPVNQTQTTSTARPLSGNHKYSSIKLKRLPIKNEAVSNSLTDPKSSSKVITVINRKMPKNVSRVLLNMDSRRTIDEIIKELGDCVKLTDARLLCTSGGNQIKSISHLKRSLNDVDTLFVDDMRLENRRSPINWRQKNFNPFKLHSADTPKSKLDEHVLDQLPPPELMRGFVHPSLHTPDTQKTFNKENVKVLTQLEQNPVIDEEKIVDHFSPNTSNAKNNSSVIHEMPSPFNSPLLKEDIDIIQSEYVADNYSECSSLDEDKFYGELEALFNENYSSRQGSLNEKEEQKRSNSPKTSSTDNDSFKLNQSQNLLNTKSVKKDQLPSFNQTNVPSVNTLPNSSLFLNERKSLPTNHLFYETNNNKHHLNIRRSASINSSLNDQMLKPFSNKSISHSLPNQSCNQNIPLYKPKTARPSRVNQKLPNKSFVLKRIFGYNGDGMGNSIRMIKTGELLYSVGSHAILWEPILNTQRHYSDHTQDICCMEVHHLDETAVSGQVTVVNDISSTRAEVRIWNFLTLKTLFITRDFEKGANLVSVKFSSQGTLLVLSVFNETMMLYVWDWKNNSLLCKCSKLLKIEEVYGAIFHPDNDFVYITYGKKHLTFWRYSENQLSIQKSFKCILNSVNALNCLSFMNNGHMITGDSEGVLSIWIPNQQSNELDFVIYNFYAHEQSITALFLYSNNLIVSGDISGVLKTWKVTGTNFNLLNMLMLPMLSGAITCIACALPDHQNLDEIINEQPDDEKLYNVVVGTSFNKIYTGSALRATNYNVMFEGHIIGIRALAADPDKKHFYTAALDQQVLKWSKNVLVWSVKAKYQCVSMAVHPSGETLVVGCTNGLMCIFSCVSGEFISQLCISNDMIGCTSFSPDGNLLAAGTQGGILHIIPVYDCGYTYDRVTMLKCNLPILSLQWSMNGRFMLTSVNEENFQEVIFWDIPSARYLKGISVLAENVIWKEITCTAGDDVCAIWNNENLQEVINLCCHSFPQSGFVIAGDENGTVRLFQYPCADDQCDFYFAKQGSTAVTEATFLMDDHFFVTCNFEGAIFLWELVN